MKLLERLEKNKGNISTVLSKRLAKEVLAGNQQILSEAVKLVVYRKEESDFKHVRCGAAKIIEDVAQARPNMVNRYLPVLLEALEVGEPQTRWMMIRTFGFCAALDPVNARRGLPFAKTYIKSSSKLCLKSSADRYLGDLGALSTRDAAVVFPLLEKSIETLVLNEQDWILEAFIAMAANLNQRQRLKAAGFARKYASSSRTSTRQRVEVLMNLIKGNNEKVV